MSLLARWWWRTIVGVDEPLAAAVYLVYASEFTAEQQLGQLGEQRPEISDDLQAVLSSISVPREKGRSGHLLYERGLSLSGRTEDAEIAGFEPVSSQAVAYASRAQIGFSVGWTFLRGGPDQMELGEFVDEILIDPGRPAEFLQCIGRVFWGKVGLIRHRSSRVGGTRLAGLRHAAL